MRQVMIKAAIFIVLMLATQSVQARAFDFTSCAAVAGAITPVPGGVGPMTIACLLHNTVKAACAIKGIKTPEM